MKTVILTGGRGTRLQPYTTVFPKPLMPIGEKPILEIVIDQLRNNGLRDIILAVGHYSELIEAFFGSGSKHGVKIEYSRENKPLGTAGALSPMRDSLDSTFLMMNGDILTDLNYNKLVEHHKKRNATATIAIKKREVNIDFGVVEVDGKDVIRKYIEKPKMDYLVSTGIYVLEPTVLEYIPKNKKMDFPNLIRLLLDDNKKVSSYLHRGYWLDIGRHEDYEQANRDIEGVYVKAR